MWRPAFFHLRSARLQACLRSCLASLSHGVDCLLMCLALKGATESRMAVQVEENMKRSSSARLVPSVGLHRGESLKAAEKCPAVEGAIEDEAVEQHRSRGRLHQEWQASQRQQDGTIASNAEWLLGQRVDLALVSPTDLTSYPVSWSTSSEEEAQVYGAGKLEHLTTQEGEVGSYLLIQVCLPEPYGGLGRGCLAGLDGRSIILQKHPGRRIKKVIANISVRARRIAKQAGAILLQFVAQPELATLS